MKPFRTLCLLLGLLLAAARQLAALALPLPPPPDSLKAVLRGATGVARYRALIRVMLAFEYQVDPASDPYANAIIPLARAAHDTLTLGLAYRVLGTNYVLRYQEDLAEPCLRQAIYLLTRAAANPADLAEVAYYQGNAENHRMRQPEARRYYRQAMAYARRSGLVEPQARFDRMISDSFSRDHRDDSVMAYLLRAQQLYQRSNDTIGLSGVDTDLGRLYTRIQRYPEALRLGREALALQDAIHYYLERHYTLRVVGSALLKVNRPREALRYLLPAYRLNEQAHRIDHLLPLATLIHYAYLDTHQLDSAEYYITKAYAMAQQAPEGKRDLGMLTSALAEIRLAQQRLPEARQLAAQSVALDRDMALTGVNAHRNSLTLSLRVASRVALRSNDYRWAYHLQHDMDSVVKLMSANESKQLLAEMQVRLQNAEAEQKVVLMQKEVRLAAQQRELAELRRRQQVLGLALLAVAALVGGLRYARRRQRHREAQLRQKLAADLHDDVGSLLTRISLESSLLNEGLADAEEQHTRRANLVDVSQQALRQMSDVVWSVNHAHTSLPQVLERMREHGYELLPAAGLELDFFAEPGVEKADLSPEALQHLYLIYKEALHNAVKHAQGASTITVELALSGPALSLRVQDNGPGSTQPGRLDGHGLDNMRRRAAEVGGTVAYDTAPGQGFAVRVALPLAGQRLAKAA